MKIVLLLGLCFFSLVLMSQECKIEFYLVKRISHTFHYHRGEVFKPLKEDLGDSILINDTELKNYLIKADTFKIHDTIVLIQDHHSIILDSNAIKRLKDSTPSICCGVPFAILVDGQIIYRGYFWNSFSSFGSDWITVFISENRLDILRKLPDMSSRDLINDPREDKLLFDCLKKTDRLLI